MGCIFAELMQREKPIFSSGITKSDHTIQLFHNIVTILGVSHHEFRQQIIFDERIVTDSNGIDTIVGIDRDAVPDTKSLF